MTKSTFPGTIKLSYFLDSNSFIRHHRTEFLLSPEQEYEERNSYLTTIFQQERHTSRITLRKISDSQFDVVDGLFYVDILLRFFNGLIPLPNMIADAFCITSEAGFVGSSIKPETIRFSTAYYEYLSKNDKFNSFVNSADVPVMFEY